MTTLTITLTTTGSASVINLDDLGFVTINHPSSVNLLSFTSLSELAESQNLQSAIDNGDVVLTDNNNNIIETILGINNVGNTPVANISFPTPLVEKVSVDDDGDPTETVLKFEGDWLTPESTARVVNPQGVVFVRWEYVKPTECFGVFDITGLNGSGMVDIRVENYGKETAALNIEANVLSSTGSRTELIDLRQGGSELTLSENNASLGNVAVYSTNNVVINRDSVVGAQYPGVNNSRTWFRYKDIEGSLEGSGTRLEKLEFIVYYGGGRLYIGIANDDDMNASGSRSEVQAIAIGVEFNSNDLRTIVGIEDGNDDWEQYSQNFDLTLGAYYRVEFDFAVNNTVYLYQLDSGEEGDWFTDSTPIFSQTNNYLSRFEQGDGPYNPVHHWVNSSSTHGLLAIRATLQ